MQPGRLIPDTTSLLLVTNSCPSVRREDLAEYYGILMALRLIGRVAL